MPKKRKESGKSADNNKKRLFKLINNSIYAKAMENLKSQVYVRLVNNTKDYLKLVSRPSFVSQKIFEHNLVVVHKIKNMLTLNKPAYVGMTILKLSMTLVYNYIRNSYGNKTKLFFTVLIVLD